MESPHIVNLMFPSAEAGIENASSLVRVEILLRENADDSETVTAYISD